jgi:hypothetical protein
MPMKVQTGRRGVRRAILSIRAGETLALTPARFPYRRYGDNSCRMGRRKWRTASFFVKIIFRAKFAAKPSFLCILLVPMSRVAKKLFFAARRAGGKG